MRAHAWCCSAGDVRTTAFGVTIGAILVSLAAPHVLGAVRVRRPATLALALAATVIGSLAIGASLGGSLVRLYRLFVSIASCLLEESLTI